MADRYWVGGTDTWNLTAGTKWSATSGGPGGASAPSSIDDVFFDANSGVGTVTLPSTTNQANCRNLDTTGFSGTFTGVDPGYIQIFGNLTIGATTTLPTGTGYWDFRATSGNYTITTNGKTLYNVSMGVSNSTATWTLGSALTVSYYLSTVSGTFNTNGLAVTVQFWQDSLSAGGRFTWNFGTTVFSYGGFNSLPLSFSRFYTINAAESTWILTNFQSGITATNPLTIGTLTLPVSHNRALRGPITCGSLVVDRQAGYITNIIAFDALTITGSLTATGNASPDIRLLFRSAVPSAPAQLVLSSSPELSNVDFLDVAVSGATVSGATLGDYGNNTGITFTAGRNCFRVGTSTTWWSTTAWSSTSGGAASVNFMPLPQDTAIIDNATTGTAITLTTANQVNSQTLAYGMPNIDLSGRTVAYTVTNSANTNFYGSLSLSPSISYTWSGNPVFRGGRTAIISGNGLTVNANITVDSPTITVRLGSALTLTTTNRTFTVTNGTFYTDNFALTASGFSVSAVGTFSRAFLGSSTITTNASMGVLTYSESAPDWSVDVGTSTNVISPASGNVVISPYTKAFAIVVPASNLRVVINGSSNGFNGLPASTSIQSLTIAASTTAATRTVFVSNTTRSGVGALEIGNLVTTSTSPIYRTRFIAADSGGLANEFGSTASRGISVISTSLTDSDFYNINITTPGNVPVTGTRLGNFGGNSGITFVTRNVYWNNAGASTWGSASWATSIGGPASLDNFPLVQDTVIFDNGPTPAAITFDLQYYVGSISTVARGLALDLGGTNSPLVWGDVTLSSSTRLVSSITFNGDNRTQTFTSGGATHTANIITDKFNGAVNLGAALTFSTSGGVFLYRGTFDTKSYAVSSPLLYVQRAGLESFGYRELILGATTWTFTATGTNIPLLIDSGVVNTLQRTFVNPGTSTFIIGTGVVSTNTQTIYLGGFSWNRFLIQPGANNVLTTFFEPGNGGASVVSAAYIGTLEAAPGLSHTVTFASRDTPTYFIGDWKVTGQSGAVVTVNRSGANTTNVALMGASPAADYLSVTNINSSLGATTFYVGANSTVTTCVDVVATAVPTTVTRFWVGGAGTWDTATTTNWSATSGGAGGASAPTAVDDVVFDSASNATGYTVTISNTMARCRNFTASGPASGNVTFSGSGLTVSGDTTIAGTGVLTSGFGMTAAGGGNTTLTTNNVTFARADNGNNLSVIKPTGTLSLGSAFSAESALRVLWGGFDTASYALSLGSSAANYIGFLNANNLNKRSISLGSSAVTITSNVTTPTVLSFGVSWASLNTGVTAPPFSGINYAQALSFNAGTSTITINTINSNGLASIVPWYATFNNVVVAKGLSIDGPATYNNLTFSGPLSDEQGAQYQIQIPILARQTINGTLSRTASVNWPTRHVVQGLNNIPAQMVVNAASLQDIYFRDVFVTGAAAPITGSINVASMGSTTGVTTSAPRTFFRIGSGNWTAAQWATTSGGAVSNANLPGAADIAVFDNNTSTGTVSMTGFVGTYASPVLGTINSSTRTAASLTLSINVNSQLVGDIINSATSSLTYSGSNIILMIGSGNQSFSGGPMNIAGISINAQKVGAGQFNLSTPLTTTGRINITCGFFYTNNNSIAAADIAYQMNTWYQAPVNDYPVVLFPKIVDWGSSIIRLSGASFLQVSANGDRVSMPNATLVLTAASTASPSTNMTRFAPSGTYGFVVGTIVRAANANLNLNGGTDIGTLATFSVGAANTSPVNISLSGGNIRVRSLRVVGSSSSYAFISVNLVSSFACQLAVTGTTPMPLDYVSVGGINATSTVPLFVFPTTAARLSGSGWTIGSPSYSW